MNIYPQSIYMDPTWIISMWNLYRHFEDKVLRFIKKAGTLNSCGYYPHFNAPRQILNTRNKLQWTLPSGNLGHIRHRFCSISSISLLSDSDSKFYLISVGNLHKMSTSSVRFLEAVCRHSQILQILCLKFVAFLASVRN